MRPYRDGWNAGAANGMVWHKADNAEPDGGIVWRHARCYSRGRLLKPIGLLWHIRDLDKDLLTSWGFTVGVINRRPR